MSVYVIAEAGVNHNGNIDLALKLCDSAKDSGVDAVKFQTFKTEKILTRNVAMADYQMKNTKSDKTQFQMIKELELSYQDFIKVKEYCDSIDIQFLSTPDDIDSLNFLVNELELKIIKISSGEMTNIPFLRQIGAKQLPVILSTGMATLAEVARAYEVLRSSGAGQINLLHCTTNYPCPMNEVNLNAMLTLREAFKEKIGYSDHTIGIEVAIAAVALGATIIEKHFTLDKKLDGPDHAASLDPKELKDMVYRIRNIEIALGDGEKKPSLSEEKIKGVVRRSIVANTKINKGELFTEQNLSVKRAGGYGLPPELWDFIINKSAQRDYKEDELI